MRISLPDRPTTRPRRSGAQLAAALALTCLLSASGAESSPTGDWPELVSALQDAWHSRDADAFAALGGPEMAADRRGLERAFAAERFLYRDSALTLRSPAGVPSYAARVGVDATVFLGEELFARVEQWRFDLERRPSGWIVTRRSELGTIDGLIQLPMDPTPHRADGLVLRSKDFELRMISGFIFTTPTALGPTAFVFIGEGVVEVTPGPESERQRLRRFCGREVLRDRVRAAFVRVRANELGDVLSSTTLTPDPRGAVSRNAASRFWKSEAPRAFVLEAPGLQRSPWWISPVSGGMLVSMATAKYGPLTFAVTPGEAEDLNLFNRQKKLQLLMYGSDGREPRYDEDDQRSFDLEHVDLAVSFDPERKGIRGKATLRFHPRETSANLRLRLAEGLQIESVSFGEEGAGVAARVRGQASVVVPLPPSVMKQKSFEVQIRYSGVLDPMALEDEAQLPPSQVVDDLDTEISLPRVLVYSNRSAWYPRNTTEDYATASLVLDVPRSQTVVSGGALISEREDLGRRTFEYRQTRPAKYLTAAIGRFEAVGSRSDGPVKLRAFASPLMKASAMEALGDMGRVLEFYAQEYGPCPYPELNLVVFEGRTPGGHSPAGMLVLQVRAPLLKQNLVPDPANFSDVDGFILAHEIAHQWWGQGVAGENYRERWLVEGAAQFAAARWVRERRGGEAHVALLRRFHQWALRYNSHGPLHLGQRLGQIEEDARVYRGIVYDKGAAVFEALSALVGKEAWRRATRLYQEDHRYAKAGSEDFREALETASGQDLGPFFAAWVYGTSLPSLTLGYRPESGPTGPRVRVDAASLDLPGEVPLRLRLVESGASREVEVRLRPGSNSWVFDVSAPLRAVEPNVDRALLLKAPAQRP